MRKKFMFLLIFYEVCVRKLTVLLYMGAHCKKTCMIHMHTCKGICFVNILKCAFKISKVGLLFMS